MEPCYLYTIIRLPKGLIFSTRIMLFLPRLFAFLGLCSRAVHSLVVVLQGLEFLIPFFVLYAKTVLKLQITCFFIAILHNPLGHILFVNVIFLCLLARLFGHFFQSWPMLYQQSMCEAIWLIIPSKVLWALWWARNLRNV